MSETSEKVRRKESEEALPSPIPGELATTRTLLKYADVGDTGVVGKSPMSGPAASRA